MHLAAVDANLFVVLRALLETRSVSLAGRRLGLSPSATSHALARLRQLFGDPLLERAGSRLTATPRAQALEGALAEALDALQATLAPPRPLDLAHLERAFRIETTDHVQTVLLRGLDRLVRDEAPGVNIYFQSLQPDTFGRLRRGDLDLAVAVYANAELDIEQTKLFDDHLVAVVRRGHPALARRLTLERFARLTHLLVAPNGTPTGLVDRLLAERGLTRRVARTSSTFLDVAFLVAETDYVVSLPHSLVAPLLARLKLAILPMPLVLPSFTHSMIWHRRLTVDPAHAWLRGVVERVVSPLSRPSPRPGKKRPGRGLA